MSSSRYIVVTVFGPLALAWIAGAASIELRTSVAIADSYVRCAQTGDFECAVRLFHVPTSLTPTEREEELRFVKRALMLFAGEFGKPHGIRTTGQPRDVAFVSVGTGSLPYWQNHPDFRRFTFSTTFERDGGGSITIDVCDVGGRPEIRQVQYGLVRTNTKATARLAEIAERLQAIASEAAK